MSNRLPLRSVAAMTVAVVSLVASTLPAGATNQVFEITNGTLTIDSLGGGPTFGFAFGQEPEEDPCDLFPGTQQVTIDIDVVNPGVSATTELMDVTSEMTFRADPVNTSSQLYRLDLSLYISYPADNTGSLVVPLDNEAYQRAYLTLEIYQLSGSPLCDKDDLACTLLAVFDSALGTDSLTGTFTDPVATPTSITVGGTGLVVTLLACDAQLNGWLDGASIEIDDLTLVP